MRSRTVAQPSSRHPSNLARTRTSPLRCTCRARGSGSGSACSNCNASLPSPRRSNIFPRHTDHGCCSRPHTQARHTRAPPSPGRKSRRRRCSGHGRSSGRGMCRLNSRLLASGGHSCTRQQRSGHAQSIPHRPAPEERGTCLGRSWAPAIPPRMCRAPSRTGHACRTHRTRPRRTSCQPSQRHTHTHHAGTRRARCNAPGKPRTRILCPHGPPHTRTCHLHTARSRCSGVGKCRTHTLLRPTPPRTRT